MRNFWTQTVSILSTCILIKTFKIKFYSVLCIMPFALICKIQIYIPNMIVSSLIIQIYFSSIKLAKFWYITCFISNFISIWPQSIDYRTITKKIRLCKLQEISAETNHQFRNGRSTLLKCIRKTGFQYQKADNLKVIMESPRLACCMVV